MSNLQHSMTTMDATRAALCVEACLDADLPVMLWGAPGIGKSDVVRAIAKKRGWNATATESGKLEFGFIDIRLSQFDPVDLRGLPCVDAGTNITKWLPPSILPFIGQEARFPERGIIFLDETDKAMAAVQASALQLTLDRAIGEHALMPGWRIVLAGNRAEDKAGAQRMISPMANRMAHIDVVFNMDAWVAWATCAGVDPLFIAFARFREELFVKPANVTARAFLTARSFTAASRFANADEAIRASLLAATVGDECAAEIEGFLRVWKRLPSLSQIIADPSHAMVPDCSEPALLYAVSTAIARKAERGNFAAVLQYAQRLPKEFEIIVATDAIRRDAGLTETGAFTAWAVRNSDVTL